MSVINPTFFQGAGGQRPPLLVRPQSDPQIVLLLTDGEAREQRLAHEVAPAPEHGRDPHAGPAAERGVETVGGAGSPALKRASSLAASAKAADPTGHWSRWPGLGTCGALWPDLGVGEGSAIAHATEVRIVLAAQELHVVRRHEPEIGRASCRERERNV